MHLRRMYRVSVNSAIWVYIYKHVVVCVLPIPFTTKMRVVGSLYLQVLQLRTLDTGAVQIAVLKFLNNLTMKLVWFFRYIILYVYPLCINPSVLCYTVWWFEAMNRLWQEITLFNVACCEFQTLIFLLIHELDKDCREVWCEENTEGHLSFVLIFCSRMWNSH